MTDHTGSEPYIMRISRMTVDKLGVRLYDRVSAVVAELVANAYDADAESVVVRVPLATLLARKNRETGEVEGYGHTIEVVEDGHGMTPEEANEHFLRVGKDRRADETQGNLSRHGRRPVMGRKGIGKLAPFGICKRMRRCRDHRSGQGLGLRALARPWSYRADLLAGVPGAGRTGQ